MTPLLVSQSTLILHLLVAAALGLLLGFERSLSAKHAGMRTYALVSLGSCLFTAVGVLASHSLIYLGGINPLQVAGPIVIGIGFIGAGLAALRGDGQPELTTASGVWLAAGVGMASGFGFYALAAAAAVLGVLIFSLLAKVEHYLRVRWGTGRE